MCRPKLTPNRLGIAAGREFIARQAPELKPIEKLKNKITTKSQIDIRPPEPLLIANYSRLFQRQAMLAAILLLAVVLLVVTYFLQPRFLLIHSCQKI